MKLFCFFTLHTIVWIFIGVENKYLPFGCTKICNNSKRTKTRRNKVIEPTTISNDLPQIVPYHIHNQVCYQQKRLCLLGHFEDVFYLLGIYKSIHTHTHTQTHTHTHTHTHSHTHNCMAPFFMDGVQLPQG